MCVSECECGVMQKVGPDDRINTAKSLIHVCQGGREGGITREGKGIELMATASNLDWQKVIYNI